MNTTVANTEKKIHPVVLILGIVFGGPILAALIGAGWVLGTALMFVLRIWLWPFRILSGMALAVLGGGR